MTPKSTYELMALSYASMCKYYQLCEPGLESKNPHFKSSLHLFKRESPIILESLNTTRDLPTPQSSLVTPSCSQQDNQTLTGGGGSSLKLLFKGKKDNKIHVKCSCNDITDGSAIKRKFLVKCNKCQAMVHGKCHNLNAQLFNNNNKNLPSSWYCSTCTVDLQQEIRKNAMVEDIKRAVQLSPPQATVLPKTSKTVTNPATQNKKDIINSSIENKATNSVTRSKSKQKCMKIGSPENIVEKADKVEEKTENKSKTSKASKKNNGKRRSSSANSGARPSTKSKPMARTLPYKKSRFIPIQPKKS